MQLRQQQTLLFASPFFGVLQQQTPPLRGVCAPPKGQLAETGRRIGEDHPRAKLSNLQADLLLTLLDAREQCIGVARIRAVSQGEIEALLAALGLSYRCLAVRFGLGLRRAEFER